MQTQIDPAQVAARGRLIYAAELKNKVEAHYPGRFLMLDVDSGDYEIDDDDIAAEDRLYSRRPEAVIYQIRIGDDAAYFLGGGWR